MLLNKISTRSVENVDLATGKNAQLKVQDAESVISGNTGNSCAGTNKHGDRKPSSNLKIQDKESQGKVHTVEEINSDFDELCFKSIQVDSSNFKPVRDEAFVKIQLDPPHIDHRYPTLKVSVDSGAQGNVLPLRVYKNMFPGQLDEDGFPTGTTPNQTKLTAYNGTQIPQHGVCSTKCSYGDRKTDAVFYVVDVTGPAICRLPTSGELHLLDLHCAM